MKQTIKTFTTLAELVPLKPSWDSLLSSSSLAFHTFDWYQSLLEIHPEEQEGLVVFVLEQNDSVTAILPCRNNGRSLRLFSDSIGKQSDIISKDRQAALGILKFALEFAREQNINANFSGVETSSHIYQCFSLLSQNSAHPMLFESAEHHQILDIEELDVDDDIERHDHQFAVFEGRNISRNLLLEIEQFHSKTGCKSSIKTSDLMPLLNRFRYQNSFGFTITTLRNANRDLTTVDIGFRRGRNYFSLVTINDSKLADTSLRRYHLHLQIDYLKKKGVRSIQTDKKNGLLFYSGKQTVVKTHSCNAYAQTKLQQFKFFLKSQKQQQSQQLCYNFGQIKIRSRLWAGATQKQLIQTGSSLQEFLRDSNSRFKERRSSSTSAK